MDDSKGPYEFPPIRQELPPLPAYPEMVYLGGPIDFAPSEARGWREETANLFAGFGIATFSPVHAFRATGEAQPGLSHRLMAVNFAAVWYSDLVLINLGTSMSVGTSREIQQAVAWGKPVVTVLDRTPGHYLVDTYCCRTLESAFETILEHHGYVELGLNIVTPPEEQEPTEGVTDVSKRVS